MLELNNKRKIPMIPTPLSHRKLFIVKIRNSSYLQDLWYILEENYISNNMRVCVIIHSSIKRLRKGGLHSILI